MSYKKSVRLTERERFSFYLRTGRIAPEVKAEPENDTLETKFNPYHDPENGRFTFAPGGPKSLRSVVTSWGKYKPKAVKPKKPHTISGRRLDVPIPPAKPSDPVPTERRPDGSITVNIPPASEPNAPDIIVTARKPSDTESIILNPTGKGVRSDSGGDGHFGASRIRRNRNKFPTGRGSHQGVDLLSEPGQDILAPISGKIREARSGRGPFSGIEISSKNGDLKVKMFYLAPDPALIGKTVTAGRLLERRKTCMYQAAPMAAQFSTIFMSNFAQRISL